MKGLADKGEREEKRRNEGQKGLGDMNPLTHITITPALAGEAATEVAAGGERTVVRLAGGGLRAFGDNHCGQLGTGAAGASLVPVPVALPPAPPA